ncbi:EboA domain-containing protein [Kitasatospora sp. NPDC001547]|uniref:EboA domain-containing protein n=1 Tax=Kitasatospora sp. NPDC001547 TaxID=3364015 RepID=UPI003683747D
MTNPEHHRWLETSVYGGSWPVPPADPEDDWPTRAERRVREWPGTVHQEFPLAGRMVGRDPVRPDADPQGLVHGTVDDLARGRLLAALAGALPGAVLAAEVEKLYRHGDDAERRGVLRALPELPDSVRRLGLELVADGLRTNDPRLVAAAMGPFAARHLPQDQWRHGVLKCLFTGVPLAAVAELVARTDSELLRMARDLAEERRAAGREIDPDLRALLGMTVLLALVPPRPEEARS